MKLLGAHGSDKHRATDFWIEVASLEWNRWMDVKVLSIQRSAR
jgi:hypothetical protein